jgi:hypothetical protein
VRRRPGPLSTLLAIIAGCRVSAVATTSPEPAAAEPEPPLEIVDVSIETAWGCVLTTDGLVRCWGHDPALASGLREPQARWETASVVSGIADAIDIDTNANWACAALASGSLRCWGPRIRQLDDLDDDTVEIALGDYVCARSSRGPVRCAEPLYSVESRPVAIERAVSITVVGSRACALDDAGMISCWGFNQSELETHAIGGRPLSDHRRHLLVRQPVIATHVDGAQRFVDDDERVCVLHDGGVSCLDSSGAMTPIPDLDDVASFAASPTHDCVMHGSGGLSCAGDNSWAQLGQGHSTATNARVDVDIGAPATLVATALGYSCAATRTEVECWGTRQISIDDPALRVRHELEFDATGVAIDGGLSCVSTTSDGLQCWGSREPAPVADHPEGILGVATPRRVDFDMDRLVDMRGGCLLDRSGRLACGHFGEPGEPEPHAASGVFTVEHEHADITDFVRVTHGWCWIQRGDLSCRAAPDGPEIPGTPKLSDPIALTAYAGAVCAVHDGGRVTCFATYASDDGVYAADVTPVAALNVVAALTDPTPSAVWARGAQGEIWSWRLRYRGGRHQLSVGSATRVEGLADDLVRFAGETCAQRDDRIECGAMIVGRKRAVTVPDSEKLVAGNRHLCTLRSDNTVTCMGDNRWGDLGVVPTTVMRRPISIELAPPATQ